MNHQRDALEREWRQSVTDATAVFGRIDKDLSALHWGQGVTYLVGKWWVCAEFVLKLPNCYPPGKCWANFKFAHLLVQILPGGFFTR